MTVNKSDRARRLQQLLHIARAVNSTLDIHEVLQTIIDTVCEETEWKIASISIVDPVSQEVVVVAQRGFLDQDAEPPRWPASLMLAPDVIQLGKTMAVSDTLELRDHPFVRENSLHRGYRAALIAPLHHVGQTATLWLCRERPTRFTPEDVAFAEAVADHAAIAIRNAQLYREEKRRTVELTQVNRTLQTLLHMAPEQRTPDEIQQTVQTLIGNPLWFESRSGRRIPDEDGPSAPPSPTTSNPIWRSAGGRTVLGVPIAVGGDHYGWLLSWEENRPFTDLDVQTLQEATLVFALSFLRERARHEVESQLRTDLFGSLMDQQSDAGGELKRRARALNIKLPTPARICLLDPQLDSPADEVPGRQQLGDVVRSISRQFPHRLVARQDDCVAMLLEPGEEETVIRVIADLRRRFPKARPCVAVGDVADQSKHYLDSFHAARRVLHLARYLGIESSVLRTEDLGVYALLFDDVRSRDLEAFRRRVLGRLLEQDSRDVMWRTLEALCSEGFNRAATARRLSIHISTLRYRTDRIVALTGINWTHDPVARLQLEVAVMIERWQRHARLHPVATGATDAGSQR